MKKVKLSLIIPIGVAVILVSTVALSKFGNENTRKFLKPVSSLLNNVEGSKNENFLTKASSSIKGLFGGKDKTKELLTEAKNEINSKDYDKALLSSKQILEKDKDNKDADEIYSIIDTYEKAKKLLDDKNSKEAKSVIDKINQNYSKYLIKEDVEELKDDILKFSKISAVDDILKEAQEYLDDKEYVKCKNLLFKDILGDPVSGIKVNEYATEEQKKKASDLLTQSQLGASDALKEKVAQEQEKAREEAKRNSGNKQIYMKKLYQLDEQSDSFNSLKKSGITSDINNALEKQYKLWDNALNEIYSELKNELSANEFEQLEKEEANWISTKESNAKKAGDSEGNVNYNSSIVKDTKQRCFVLVNNYMK